mgnify:CR=1 FL=1
MIAGNRGEALAKLKSPTRLNRMGEETCRLIGQILANQLLQ